MSTEHPIRVLSLDGGGVRGLYTALLLRDLSHWFAQREGKGSLDVGRGFDLITGTSTGGILACGLAYGLPPADIVDLYREEGPRLFTRPVPTSTPAKLAWAARTVTKAANPNGPLRTALQRILGDETLGEVWDRRGIALCIPTVDAGSHEPRVFKTPHIEGKLRDNPWKLVDVCLATGAAPIVLPLAECPDPADRGRTHVFADGGLWANNPILVGLIDALALPGSDRPIRVLSLGTCGPPEGRTFQGDTNWGLGQWNFGLKPLTMSLDAQARGHLHMAKFLARHMKRDCEVTRVPDPAISAEHASSLGLDRAHAEAFEALGALAHRSLSEVQAAVTSGTVLGRHVESFFTAMPERTEQEAAS